MSMSMPMQQSEMSMSMPLVTSEMSMSMGMPDVMAQLETSEMNMPDANAASVSPGNALPEEIADAADSNSATGFFDSINVTSATDAVTDTVTDVFDNITTIPLGNFSSIDDATEEPTTSSGAVASSSLSHISCFVSVTVSLFIVGRQL
jgi:hypothetical protein